MEKEEKTLAVTKLQAVQRGRRQKEKYREHKKKVRSLYLPVALDF